VKRSNVKRVGEPQTYTELMTLHGFSVPDTGDERADYKRMEDISSMIEKNRRREGLPVDPCSACGQRRSGCWASPHSGEQLCANQPPSIDFGDDDIPGSDEGPDF
jgi:hypothetical protein